MADLAIRLLGSFEVLRGTDQLALGGPKQKSVLAMLVLARQRVISTDELIERLWPDRPPTRPSTAVQGYISHLRRLLEPPTGSRHPSLLVTESAGYALRADPDSVDVSQFELALAEGHAALSIGNADAAAPAFERALQLWRGPALADFVDDAWARPERERLEELRLLCVEERFEAALALGHHASVIASIEELVQAHPLRERLRGQLMRALYLAGRQAEALDVLRTTRKTLSDELGIDPSPQLQDLELAILRQDPALQAQTKRVPARPSNVSAPSTPIVGRRVEVDAIEALLARDDVRLVTLTGPGGVGKTRLALEIALRSRGRYADGVWWVALQSITESTAVMPTTAQALGAPGDLAKYVADRDILLVLDNFEQLVDAAADLATLLARAPRLKLLVTSRQNLRISAEHEYPLAPLPPVDAVALFEARAEAVRPGAALSSEVRDVCSRLDGLPLALELAAAWIKTLSMREILDRLERRLPLLIGGKRDLPQRQRTLTATIDWSYELLSSEERQLFVKLAVFAGGFTLDAAQNVCEASITTLAALLDKSLVNRADDRYKMLETIREFAEAQLDAGQEQEELRQRHAGYFRAFAQNSREPLRDDNNTRHLDLVASEHDNLRTALHWFVSRRDAPAAADIVQGIFHYWRVRGFTREGRRWAEQILGLPEANQMTERAPLLNIAAEFARVHGDTRAARSYAETAVQLFRPGGSKTELAEALYNLGVVAIDEGDYHRSRRLQEEGLALRRELGDPTGISYALNGLTALAIHEKDYERARETAIEEVDLARPVGGVFAAAAIHNLSEVLAKCGNYADGAIAAEEALTITLRFRSMTGAAFCLSTLASIAAALGDTERAAQLRGASDRLLNEAGESHFDPDAASQLRFMRDTLGERRFSELYDEGGALGEEGFLAKAAEVVAEACHVS